MRAARRTALAVLLLLPAVAGCRYTSGGALPPEVKTIGVTMLRNETRYPGLEAEVTRAIVFALNSDGRLKVIDAESDPDLVMVGRVVSYTRSNANTDRYGDAVKYNVVVTARVSVRGIDGDYLFKDLIITNRTAHPRSGEVDLAAGQRESHGRSEAVRDLGRSIARKVVEQGW